MKICFCCKKEFKNVDVIDGRYVCENCNKLHLDLSKSRK